MRFSLLLVPLLLVNFAHGQIVQDSVPVQKDIPLELRDKLQDVQAFNLYQGAAWAEQYLANTASIDTEIMTGVALFLKDLGPYSVSLTTHQREKLRQEVQDSCDWAEVSFHGHFDPNAFEEGGMVDLSIGFQFCNDIRYVILLEDYPVPEDDEHYETIKVRLMERFASME